MSKKLLNVLAILALLTGFLGFGGCDDDPKTVIYYDEDLFELPDFRPDVPDQTDVPEIDEEVAFCGDGNVDPGEECDEGELNSNSTPNACRENCRNAYCGDFVTDEGEDCDDGNMNSDVNPNACRMDCSLPTCGDGVIDDDEAYGELCDGNNVGTATCMSVDASFGGGTLRCNAGCDAYDTSACILRPENCGNGVIDEGEDCDGEELNDATCDSLGLGDGELSCSGLCLFDTTACELTCLDDDHEPNDTLETAADLTLGSHADLVICPDNDDFFAIEVCDGGTLAALVSFTHTDGDLNAFLLDAAGEILAEGVSEDDDETLTFENTGEAAVTVYLHVAGVDGAGNAYGVDLSVSGCSTVNPCDPNPCTAPPATGCNTAETAIVTYDATGTCAVVDGQAECTYAPIETPCVAAVVCVDNTLVTTTGACTELSEGPICVETSVDCGTDHYCDAGECKPLCGNGVIDGDEECDTTELDSKTCDDFTGLSGTGLACAADCTFDTSACTAVEPCGDGVCDVAGGETRTNCPADCTPTAAWTCTVGFFAADDGCDCGCGEWDPDCDGPDVTDCDWCGGTGSCNTGSCPGNIDPNENWLCLPPAVCGDGTISGAEVCEPTDLAGQTCDDFLGFTGTGLACAANCLSFDTSGCTPTGECLVSPIDDDLGSAVGEVSTGTTVGASNDFASTGCGGAGPDLAFTWTPPATGCFTIDTFGSAFDTVLHVRSCAAGSQIVCNDDTGGSQSRVRLLAEAGVEYVIIVDGYSATHSGDYVLNITQEADGCTCLTCPATQPATCSTDGTARITYSAGACDSTGGAPVCVYTETTVPCNTPPTDGCVGQVYTVYDSAGTCGGTPGVCSYASLTEDCAAAGQVCTTSGCEAAPEGLICTNPVVVTEGVTSLTGTFTEDLPADTFACATTFTNVVWYQFSPTESAEYDITAVNATTTGAYSRLVVLDGTSCNPYDTTLVCGTASAKNITRRVSLTAGEDYLIAFGTDGNAFTMVDPTLTITKYEVPVGAECTDPVTASLGVTTATGSFEADLAADSFSCGATPFNVAWFSFTPAEAGEYDLTAVNASTTLAGSRLVVLTGDTCAPYGAEVVCGTAAGKTISRRVTLAANETYLIAFFTDGNTYTMVNPTLTITKYEAAPGDTCAAPIVAVEGVNSVTRTFTEDLAASSFSCGATPYNVVWYAFTPSATKDYEITAVNATTATASSRLVILEGASCTFPRTADEVLCGTTTTKTITRRAVLDAGTTYLMAFFTNLDSATMVDPTLTIVEYVAPAGSLCTDPIVASDGLNSVSDSFTEDLTLSDTSCGFGSPRRAATNVVWYSYTAGVTGAHTVTATNASTSSYSGLTVFNGTDCAPTGSEVLCSTQNNRIITRTVNLTEGESYLFLHFTDGDTWPMTNPSLEITPPVVTDPCAGVTCTTPPGDTCSGGQLVTYASPGTCQVVGGVGECTYTSSAAACASGFECLDGNTACTAVADPCAGVTCTNPPGDTCSGGQLVTYASPGTCQVVGGVGECSYTSSAAACASGFECLDGNMACTAIPDPCDPNPCDAPPAGPVCNATDTGYLTYPATGTCTNNAGTAECTYTATETLCTGTDVCVSGACVPAGTTPETIVGWNFEGDSRAASVYSTNNAGKTVTVVGAGPTYSFTAGAVGNAVSTTNWHDATTTEKYWLAPFDTTGYENLVLVTSFQRSSGGGPRDFKVQYSTNGSTWNDVAGASVTTADNMTSGVLTAVPLPAALSEQPTAYLRWIVTTTVSVNNGVVGTGGTSRLDEVYISGVPTGTVDPCAGVTCPNVAKCGTNAIETWSQKCEVQAGNPVCVDDALVTTAGCTSAPATTCSGGQLVTYASPGACVLNAGTPECTYTSSSAACTATAAACVGGLLRTYTATCPDGQSACQESHTDAACQSGFECLDGNSACTAIPDPCAGVTCPNVAKCGTNAIETWSQKCEVQAGNPVCVDDALVTTAGCTSPPADTCLGGELVIYANPGVCQVIAEVPQCVYAPNPSTCLADAPICDTDGKLVTYTATCPVGGNQCVQTGQAADCAAGFACASGACVCQDDAYEPNDTSANATLLTNNQTYLDLVLCGDNVDYYAFTVCPGGEFYVEADFGLEGAALTLLDASGLVELDSDDTTTDLLVGWENTGTEAATVILEVLNLDDLARNTYDLVVTESGCATKEPVTFYFQGPTWMNNVPSDPQVCGPFAAPPTWDCTTMTFDAGLGWWSAEVMVDDASAEITYQVRFDQDGVTKYQRAVTTCTDPTFTTTTGEIWIDASPDVAGWCAEDNFYLAAAKITETEPVVAPVTVVGWNFDNADLALKRRSTAGTASNTGTNFKVVTVEGATGYTNVASAAQGPGVAANAWDGADLTPKYWLAPFDSTGFGGLVLVSSFQGGSGTGPRDFKVQYSINGIDWVDVSGGSVTLANNWTTGVLTNIALPAALNNQATAYLRWIVTSTTSIGGGVVAAGGTSRLDEVYISGVPL